MSKYIYTVKEHGPNGVKKQTFEGFQRYTGKSAKLSDKIAIVCEYEEIEVWALSGDVTRAVEELQRMYRMLYNNTPTVYLYKSL